tara:strand:+ start:334 stop:672 length:339 start_codon:yes stop_codon:yes gene_type:complete
MNSAHKLLAIRILHTIIWIFFASVIFYIAYCGIADAVTIYTWVGIGLVLVEGLVLLIFNMYCPLTLVARNYSNSTQDNFDIFLPNWLAKYNKHIFTVIFGIGLLAVLYRSLS